MDTELKPTLTAKSIWGLFPKIKQAAMVHTTAFEGQ